MSDRQFERAVIDWLEDGSDRTPPSAIDAVLLAAKTTPQERDLRIPWRFLPMPVISRATGIAAVALVAVVGAGGLMYLASDRGGGAGSQGTTAPTTAPATTPPTAAPTAQPTQAVYVPPPLSETFTSDIHGLSIGHPAGWSIKAATTPWTTSGGPFSFGDTAADFIFDPTRTEDHDLFIAVASQPLGNMTFDEWLSTEVLDNEFDPPGAGPIMVDGANGFYGAEMALVSIGGRGYAIWLHTGDDPDLVAFEVAPWFQQILATVQLAPEDAVDTTP